MNWLFVFISIFSFPVFSQEEVQLAALAKVGDNESKIILTTRDLQISLFFNEQDNFLKPFAERRDPLKELVWEELLYIEARQVLLSEITAATISSFVSDFKKKLGSDKLWSALHVTDRELNAAAKKRISSRRLLNLKMGSKDLIFVSDEEIESFYIQNRNQLGQKPLSEVRDKIKASLQSVKAQGRFQDWINAITRTHGVTYFSGYKIQ